MFLKIRGFLVCYSDVELHFEHDGCEVRFKNHRTKFYGGPLGSQECQLQTPEPLKLTLLESVDLVLQMQKKLERMQG